MRKFLKNKDGAILPNFAISISLILVSVGVAIDMNSTHKEYANLQYAVDTATLAASRVQGREAALSVANEVFNANFFSNSLQNLSANFTINSDEVIGVSGGDVPLSFARFLGRDKNPISVSSRVLFNMPDGDPCILTLSQTRTGLRFNSGSQIITPNCETHTHSLSNPATTIESGTILNTRRLCIAGDRIINNRGNDPKIQTSCRPDPDPYAGVFPVPSDLSCDFNNQNHNGPTVNLTPGVYCGHSNFNNSNANVTFAPGLYVIRNGGWNVNGGDWKGDGVTFYFADSSRIQFNSAVRANLSAPTSGPYANVFMTEAPGLPISPFILNDSRGFDAQGIVYLPSRDLTFNSGSQVRSLNMNLVTNTLIVNNGVLALESVTAGTTETVLINPYLAD